MLLPTLAVVVGLLVGLSTGGKPRWASRHAVHAPWLVVAGVVAEVVAGRWTLGWLGPMLLVGGYGFLLAFVVRNRTLLGVPVVGAGLVANLAVIVANGGMPVRPQAVVDAGITSVAGLPALHYGPRHHAERASTHLPWLDDRLPVAVIHSVVSAGDVILAVGVVMVVASCMHYQGRYQRRRLGRAALAGLVRRAS
ncbi:MAG: DUF5317 domain-containing protein [Acidimicrobiaceae bacterium]|nr:DUF5317 domain-containing protein [Acidimicrobiaceae bacterium]